jgi:hypothetical protein
VQRVPGGVRPGAGAVASAGPGPGPGPRPGPGPVGLGSGHGSGRAPQGRAGRPLTSAPVRSPGRSGVRAAAPVRVGPAPLPCARGVTPARCPARRHCGLRRRGLYTPPRARRRAAHRPPRAAAPSRQDPCAPEAAGAPRPVRRRAIDLRWSGTSRRVVLDDAGWSSSVARWAHNPEVAGSNPVPATTPESRVLYRSGPGFRYDRHFRLRHDGCGHARRTTGGRQDHVCSGQSGERTVSGPGDARTRRHVRTRWRSPGRCRGR